MAADDGKGPILVPKRFGWGWALNFRRPIAWVLLPFLIAAAVGFGLLIGHMFHLPRARPF